MCRNQNDGEGSTSKVFEIFMDLKETSLFARVESFRGSAMNQRRDDISRASLHVLAELGPKR